MSYRDSQTSSTAAPASTASIVSMHQGIPDARLCAVRPHGRLAAPLAARIAQLYAELLNSQQPHQQAERLRVLTELVRVAVAHRPHNFAEFWWYSDFTAMLLLVRNTPLAFCLHKSHLIMHTFQTPTELWDACPIKINLLARTLFGCLGTAAGDEAADADTDTDDDAAPLGHATAASSPIIPTDGATNEDVGDAAADGDPDAAATSPPLVGAHDVDVYNLVFVVQQICNLNRLAYYVAVALLWAALYRHARQPIHMFRMHRLGDLVPLLGASADLERPLELPLASVHRLLTLVSAMQSLVVLRKPRHEEYVCFRAFFRVPAGDLGAITAWLQLLKEKMEFVGAKKRENEDCLQIIEMLDLDILHFMEQKMLEAAGNGGEAYE